MSRRRRSEWGGVASSGVDDAQRSDAGYKLPDTLVPYPDESLPGLVTRIARLYSFPEPMRLFRRLSPPKVTLWTFCQTMPTSATGHAMRVLLGLDEDAFRRLSMWAEDDNYLSILGTPMWSELVRHRSRAVCPLCLAESVHHRAAWLIDALPACPRHAVWLRHQCYGCGKPLAWTGMEICGCGNTGCKADLRHASAEPINERRLGAVSALNRLFLGDGTGNPLGMPTGEAIRLSFLFGQLVFEPERGKRPPGFIVRELDNLPEIMQTGWDALNDWPHGFYRLMDSLRAKSPDRRGSRGLCKAFGRLPRMVSGLSELPWGQKIGVAFSEHAATLPEVQTSRHVLRQYAPRADLARKHLSINEASEFLDISMFKVTELAERRNLYVVAPQGSGTPAAIDIGRLEALREELADFIFPSEARALLGVSYGVVVQLEEAGLVGRVPPGEWVMESRPYRRSQIVTFLNACLRDAATMTPAEARAAGLTSLNRTGGGRPAADVCLALLEGRLRPAARVSGAKGLAALRLNMEEVRQAVPIEVKTLSVLAVAEKLGADHSTMHTWIQRGLLRACKPGRNRERGLRVEPGALAEFEREYVSGGDLPALLGLPKNNWLSRHLQRRGIMPVAGKDVDGSSISLFRRSDLTEEVVEALKSLKEKPSATPEANRLASFARAERAARVVEARWKATFRQDYNLFTDEETGRVLQVVVGLRPGMTGSFGFKLGASRVALLDSIQDAWVMLLPNQGQTFLLMPHAEINWRRQPNGVARFSLVFDGTGAPTMLTEWAVSFETG